MVGARRHTGGLGIVPGEVGAAVRDYTVCRQADGYQRATRPRRRGCKMDFLEGLLGFVLMLVFLVVVIGAVAALFMIVFGIATGIDDRIQN